MLCGELSVTLDLSEEGSAHDSLDELAGILGEDGAEEQDEEEEGEEGSGARNEGRGR